MTNYKVTNPATGTVEKEFPEATDDELNAVLDRAAATFDTWSKTAAEERATLLNKVADLYAQRKDDLAMIITREMGKPVKQARGELDIVIDIYRYYAKNGPAYLADEPIEDTKHGTAYIQSEPYGVLLGIMPWNFPYYQVARFAAPNLPHGRLYQCVCVHRSGCRRHHSPPAAAGRFIDRFRRGRCRRGSQGRRIRE